MNAFSFQINTLYEYCVYSLKMLFLILASKLFKKDSNIVNMTGIGL